MHPKRRRTSNSKVLEGSLELKEHCVARSQQSSPSKSDHDQTSVQKNIGTSYPSSRAHMLFRQNTSTPNSFPLNNSASNQSNSRHSISRTFHDVYPALDHPNQEHKNVVCSDACRAQCSAAESLGKTRNLVLGHSSSTHVVQFFYYLLSIQLHSSNSSRLRWELKYEVKLMGRSTPATS